MAFRRGKCLSSVCSLIFFVINLTLQLWPFASCNSIALSLQGKPSSQSTTHIHLGVALEADLATDGNTNTTLNGFSCTHTSNDPEAHLWWKVDLAKTRIIGRVSLLNRGDCCSERLIDAVVRVGLNSDIYQNAVCGSPVTSSEAALGAWVVRECDPPVAGRYVSVDINRDMPEQTSPLTLCEVKVEEYIADDTTYAPLESKDPWAVISGNFKLMYEGSCMTDPRALATVSTGSRLRCATRCIRHDQCTSFDYVSTTGRCRLYSKVSAPGVEPDCSVFTTNE